MRRPVVHYREFAAVTAVNESVAIRGKVEGVLKEVLFSDGEPIAPGQLLFVFDEEPYRVALDMARARLAGAEAEMKKAELSKAIDIARAHLSLDLSELRIDRITENRDRALFSRDAVTREVLDRSESQRRADEARVEVDRIGLEQITADFRTNILLAKSKVEAARAVVRDAEVNLGYCRITAPSAGRISRGIFCAGSFVAGGKAGVLATIHEDDPIYVHLNLSEHEISEVRQLASEAKARDPRGGGGIKLELDLLDGRGFPHRGKLVCSNPVILPGSGNYRVRGIFPNPNRSIAPGQAVRVRVALKEDREAMLVPERVVVSDLSGHHLLVVARGEVVERRSVKTGELAGDLRVIEAGLKPEDLVIVDGIRWPRPGSKVTPHRRAAAEPPAQQARPQRVEGPTRKL